MPAEPAKNTLLLSGALVTAGGLGDICVLRFSHNKFGDHWHKVHPRLPFFIHQIGRPCVIAHQNAAGEWKLFGWSQAQDLSPVQEIFEQLHWRTFHLWVGASIAGSASPFEKRLD
jgi:hypothetical protein